MKKEVVVKLGINRSELMREAHEKCKQEIKPQLRTLSMTVQTPGGKTKQYTRRVLTRNRDRYRECIAREIRNKIQAAVEAAVRTTGATTA